MKKAVYQKPKKKRSNKKIIASVNKKDSYVND